MGFLLPTLSAVSLQCTGEAQILSGAYIPTTSPLLNHKRNNTVAAMVILNMDVGSLMSVKWRFQYGHTGTEREMCFLAGAASHVSPTRQLSFILYIYRHFHFTTTCDSSELWCC